MNSFHFFQSYNITENLETLDVIKKYFSLRWHFFLNINSTNNNWTVYKLFSCNLQELLICFNLKNYECLEHSFLIHTCLPSIFKLEIFNSKNTDNLRNLASFKVFDTKNIHSQRNLTSFKLFNFQNIYSPRFLSSFKLSPRKFILQEILHLSNCSTPRIFILQEILHLSNCSTPRIFILQEIVHLSNCSTPKNIQFEVVISIQTPIFLTI